MKKLIFILVVGLLIASCQTVPPPTSTPLPTLKPLPTLVPLATYTPFPTRIPSTITPSLTPTDAILTPTQTPYLVLEVVAEKSNLREVCQNKKGVYQFNAKGFPIMFDCIYSSDGTVNGRVKYVKGDQLVVYVDGDRRYSETYDAKLTLGGNAIIKSDGGWRWYMVAGPYGRNYFINTLDVVFVSNFP